MMSENDARKDMHGSQFLTQRGDDRTPNTTDKKVEREEMEGNIGNNKLETEDWEAIEFVHDQSGDIYVDNALDELRRTVNCDTSVASLSPASSKVGGNEPVLRLRIQELEQQLQTLKWSKTQDTMAVADNQKKSFERHHELTRDVYELKIRNDELEAQLLVEKHQRQRIEREALEHSKQVELWKKQTAKKLQTLCTFTNRPKINQVLSSIPESATVYRLQAITSKARTSPETPDEYTPAVNTVPTKAKTHAVTKALNSKEKLLKSTTSRKKLTPSNSLMRPTTSSFNKSKAWM